jgi:hypothetical protein
MFKVGDKVFHIKYGWGIIEEKKDEDILSRFDEYTVWSNSDNNLLSFTEYTLEGFSQERPIILPEVGELCLVRDIDIEDWHAVKFKERDKNKMPHQFIDSTNAGWGQMKRIKILD